MCLLRLEGLLFLSKGADNCSDINDSSLHMPSPGRARHHCTLRPNSFPPFLSPNCMVGRRKGCRRAVAGVTLSVSVPHPDSWELVGESGEGPEQAQLCSLGASLCLPAEGLSSGWFFESRWPRWAGFACPGRPVIAPHYQGQEAESVCFWGQELASPSGCRPPCICRGTSLLRLSISREPTPDSSGRPWVTEYPGPGPLWHHPT